MALLFFICGLVIPISLGDHFIAGFIPARALRIFSTYVTGRLLTAAAVCASDACLGMPMAPGGLTLAINGLLILDIMGLNLLFALDNRLQPNRRRG